MKTPFLLALGGVISLVVAGAACSGTDASIPSAFLLGTDGGSSNPTTHPTGTSTSSATGTSTSTPPGSDGGGGSDAAASPPPGTPAWTTLPTTSSGCGQSAATSPTAGDTGSVTVNGTTRTYVYFVPPMYNPAHSYPLVTLFHGVQATGEEMAMFIEMQNYSSPDAITAFPDAAGGYWDITGTTDLQFYAALLAKLESQLCINQQRTFALGFSYGAYMVNHLACNTPTLRAFVAADGGYPDTAACKSPMSAFIYHRQEDDNEVIANGINARNKWLATNGCSMSTSPFTSDGFLGPIPSGEDLSQPGGCVSYSGCTGSVFPTIWCDDMYISPEGYKHDLRDVYRIPMWNWFNAFP